MALALITTPGSPSANSYTSIAESDTFHDGHVYAAAWWALDPRPKVAALVHATRLLDEQVAWYGTTATRTQALRWPRIGVPERDSVGSFLGDDRYYGYGYGIDTDSTVIPQWLKNATAELARCLVIEDRTAEPDLLEFTQIQVGTLSLTKDSNQRKDVLPESVRAMVKFYGVVQTHTGVGIARLIRV
jgi:hypothetical protein